MARIAPLDPPYAPDVAAALAKWMPPGSAREPLVLFRVLQRHPELASRMRVLGAGLLGHGALPPADRELVILRTCARAACWYEWGVHAEAFAGPVGLTPDQVAATASGTGGDLLIRAADELHDSARWSARTWEALRGRYTDEQLVELLALAGWYRTISYVANNLLDAGDARQDDVLDRTYPYADPL
ncbi:carboxymuconolactone decarboxylase family protein [Phytohabitans sp. ZYX-F-186]|uniref:Carboxymuconolactone decarboxylase family protein n=1 Tax=Phytohabitans maris TaxID=3071409 RepID=A0ABU0ZL77_9ACTN|nr:carboxymuconolactone decarboxylase family protein [Phytohabitans sp. ZYX-F-186]MDQ7907796.1 carboxymuconolactone decarboxylase family protein [Phytohabitans sp. ZYX-F-186]